MEAPGHQEANMLPLLDAIMRSSKSAAPKPAKSPRQVVKRSGFSAIMKTVEKPPAKQADREMVFISYLMEKGLGSQLEAKSSRKRNSK